MNERVIPLAGERLKPLGHLSGAVCIRSKAPNARGFWRFGPYPLTHPIDRQKPEHSGNGLGKAGESMGILFAACSGAAVTARQAQRQLIKSHRETPCLSMALSRNKRADWSLHINDLQAKCTTEWRTA